MPDLSSPYHYFPTLKTDILYQWKTSINFTLCRLSVLFFSQSLLLNYLPHLKIPSVWSPLRPRTSSERRVCTQGSWLSGYRSFWSAITSSKEEPNMEGLKIAFLACLISSRQGFCKPWRERQTHTHTHTQKWVNVNIAGQMKGSLSMWSMLYMGQKWEEMKQRHIGPSTGHTAHQCAVTG